MRVDAHLLHFAPLLWVFNVCLLSLLIPSTGRLGRGSDWAINFRTDIDKRTAADVHSRL